MNLYIIFLVKINLIKIKTEKCNKNKFSKEKKNKNKFSKWINGINKVLKDKSGISKISFKVSILKGSNDDPPPINESLNWYINLDKSPKLGE